MRCDSVYLQAEKQTHTHTTTHRKTDTQTDTQTDNPGIFGPLRSQYIQSMKMTECKKHTLMIWKCWDTQNAKR